jgi:hypothetical protein
MPPDRCLHLAIGTAAQFELMLRQMDIIGEWAKATASRKLPAGITTLEHGPDIWAGFFTWHNIPGWRWRTKTSKSKYRSAADFDLTKYDLLLPLLDAVPHENRSGAIVKGEKNLPVRQAMYARWWRQIARRWYPRRRMEYGCPRRRRDRGGRSRRCPGGYPGRANAFQGIDYPAVHPTRTDAQNRAGGRSQGEEASERRPGK